MAREFGRTERVADYLRQELARLLQMEVRDDDQQFYEREGGLSFRPW